MARMAGFSLRCSMQPPPRRHTGGAALRGIAEQLGELLRHGAGQFLGVGDGHGAAVIARDVMADADGDQLHWRIGLDLMDDLPQMPLQVSAIVHRQRGIVHRRAVGDHHDDAPLLRPRQQPRMRPGQRLAVDVLL